MEVQGELKQAKMEKSKAFGKISGIVKNIVYQINTQLSPATNLKIYDK